MTPIYRDLKIEIHWIKFHDFFCFLEFEAYIIIELSKIFGLTKLICVVQIFIII